MGTVGTLRGGGLYGFGTFLCTHELVRSAKCFALVGGDIIGKGMCSLRMEDLELSDAAGMATVSRFALPSCLLAGLLSWRRSEGVDSKKATTLIRNCVPYTDYSPYPTGNCSTE